MTLFEGVVILSGIASLGASVEQLFFYTVENPIQIIILGLLTIFLSWIAMTKNKFINKHRMIIIPSFIFLMMLLWIVFGG